MKTIALTRGYVAVVDDDVFAALSAYRWHVKVSPGVVYAVRRVRVEGRWTDVLMHREILSPEPGLYIDHINGDTLDNRRRNLRAATKSQNGQNRGKPSDNSTGFKGIWWSAKDRVYRAAIRVQGNRYGLGSFQKPEDAARAYDDAARHHFGEFACVNFPIGDERSAR